MTTDHPVPPDVISGPRLDLVLVSVEQLLARDAADGPVPLGYADPTDVLHPDRSPLHHRVPQVLADPSVNPWLVRLAVLRETGEIVGLINFHAPPDADGMVEIGYSVVPEFRRRGYATEMAETMWTYAASHPSVRIAARDVHPRQRRLARDHRGGRLCARWRAGRRRGRSRARLRDPSSGLPSLTRQSTTVANRSGKTLETLAVR